MHYVFSEFVYFMTCGDSYADLHDAETHPVSGSRLRNLELQNQTFQISIPGLKMLEEFVCSEHHTPRDVIYGGCC